MDLLNNPDEQICKVQDCFHTGLKVKMYCRSLVVHENALAKQILNRGILPMCILHAKMHMCEKLIQPLILTGLHKNSSGVSFKTYCNRVESAVNSDILGRTTCHTENG